MKPAGCCLFVVAIACLVWISPVFAKERKPPEPIAWCLVTSDSVEVRPRPGARKKAVVRLKRGALVPVLEEKRSAGRVWTRVLALDPPKLVPQSGWVDSGHFRALPFSQFPPDAELLKMLGGPYLDDFTASHTAIARYVVARGPQEPALVCSIGSPILPLMRLQVFLPAQDKLTAGTYLEFPFMELQAAITSLEVRDLAGDGNECIITHEHFTMGPEHFGVNMVIRRIEAGALRVLWQAPVMYRNLASYPAKMQTASPPERNIGVAGTVTSGDVEFRPRGRVTDLVWKGKVEFYAVGREQPVGSLPIERTYVWDGARFAPLR